MQSSIVSNIYVLKRQKNPHAEKTAKEKRKMRRVIKAKTVCKRITLKAYCESRGSDKIVGRLSFNDLQKKCKKFFQLSDLEKDATLVSKSHHKSLKWPFLCSIKPQSYAGVWVGKQGSAILEDKQEVGGHVF